MLILVSTCQSIPMQSLRQVPIQRPAYFSNLHLVSEFASWHMLQLIENKVFSLQIIQIFNLLLKTTKECLFHKISFPWLLQNRMEWNYCEIPTITITPHHLEMTFSIAVHDVANQDQVLELLEYQVWIIIKKKKKEFYQNNNQLNMPSSIGWE